MRLIAILIFFALLPTGSARAEAPGPIFGGSAAGSFMVADQQVNSQSKKRIVIRAINDCTSLDCTGSIKPANPASVIKP